jgi:GntR family transcriptional repressor for pyruvate dehydrogenase complex
VSIVSTAVGSFERRALPDLVAEQLMQAITRGDYKPGEQLPTEPELARQLGVGRTSLREAIQRMRTLGVVEVRKGLGTFVVDQPRSDPILAFAAWAAENEFKMTEVFEARLSLEATAAGLAAERATARDVSRLRAAARRHIDAHSHSLADLVSTDETFHGTLFAIAGNGLLAQLYGMLTPGLVQYRTMSLALPGSPHRSAGDHMAMVDAIEAKDARRARGAVVDHLWVLYNELTQAAGMSGRSRRGMAGRAVWD